MSDEQDGAGVYQCKHCEGSGYVPVIDGLRNPRKRKCPYCNDGWVP